mgnify:CR=1 FL=1
MNECHILSLSGGKDSTALAFFIKENYPKIHKKIEYVFYDTGCDLVETYDYLNKIEIFLEKKIIFVKPKYSFEEIFLKTKMLPTIFRRWCTLELKIKPSNEFLKNRVKNENLDKVKLYIGIRADEQYRKGVQLKTDFEKKYIEPCYPFIKNGITKQDVETILINSGINYPDYYKWRKRNGCFFCPYQTPFDWLMLYENHPELFFKAMEYEKIGDVGNNIKFKFNPKFSLEEILKNKSEILEKEKKKKAKKNIKQKLIDIFC